MISEQTCKPSISHAGEVRDAQGFGDIDGFSRKSPTQKLAGTLYVSNFLDTDTDNNHVTYFIYRFTFMKKKIK